MKLNTQQVARAGEAFVVAEIHRRGGYAAAFAGNMPAIDVVASDVQQARTVYLQVKTKTGRDWQTSIDRGKLRKELQDQSRFWVLVDLGKDHPDYYIVPEWWLQNDIYETHEAYLNRQGGHRRHSRDSRHHSISGARVPQWLNRWDVLGIFATALTDPTNVDLRVVEEADR